MRDAATPEATGLVSAHRRSITIACWAVIAAVLLRIASGGGSLTGLGYVLRTEPALAVAAGAFSLITGAVVVLALVRGWWWAWAASRLGATIALAASVILVLGGHDSAVLAAAGAIVARVVAAGAGHVGPEPPG